MLVMEEGRIMVMILIEILFQPHFHSIHDLHLPWNAIECSSMGQVNDVVLCGAAAETCSIFPGDQLVYVDHVRLQAIAHVED